LQIYSITELKNFATKGKNALLKQNEPQHRTLTAAKMLKKTINIAGSNALKLN
jgi:hypothetical protein